MNRELVIKWLEQADKLSHGDALCLEAESKHAVKKLQKLFDEELKVLETIDPIQAGNLFTHIRCKETRWWLYVEKMSQDPLTGYIKRAEGAVERVELKYDPSRLRKIETMTRDGYLDTDIEEVFPDLTSSERSLIKNWRC